MRALAAVALALLVMNTGTRGAAAVERQQKVGMDTGGAALAIAGKPSLSIGAGAGAHYLYGLNDQFDLTVEGAWSRVALEERIEDRATPRNRPTDVAHGGAGVRYVLDVMRWVPYVGLSAHAYALSGGTLPQTKWVLGAALQLGADYQINRTLAVGLGLRQHMLLGAIDTYPSFTTVMGRFEYMFGW